jgi:hypothetical protein
MQEEKKLVNGMDAMTPKKPEGLKNLSSWVKWWESWDNYIYHFRAEARCPLSYIHRLHTEVTSVGRVLLVMSTAAARKIDLVFFCIRR